MWPLVVGPPPPMQGTEIPLAQCLESRDRTRVRGLLASPFNAAPRPARSSGAESSIRKGRAEGVDATTPRVESSRSYRQDMGATARLGYKRPGARHPVCVNLPQSPERILYSAPPHLDERVTYPRTAGTAVQAKMAPELLSREAQPDVMAYDRTDRVPVPPSARQVVSTLHHSLDAALARKCNRRYDAAGVLEVDWETAEGKTMELHVPGRAPLPVQFEVEHAGGNVYDVTCALGDGAPRRFVHCSVPDARPASSRPTEVGRKVATFLLNELEARVGRTVLRRSSQGPLRTAAPSRKREARKRMD